MKKSIIFDIIGLICSFVCICSLASDGLSSEILHHPSLFCVLCSFCLGFLSVDLFFSVLHMFIDRKDKRKPPKI
ncbi:MAG: hypothetical protein K2G83_01835 [Ruminococcus sp.]|nr:hypothetical protein [Ruminococcus sp.]